MAEILVIRLTPAAAEAASWCVVDSGGSRLGPAESGALRDAVRLATQRKVYVLVPAAEVLFATADLPVRSAAKMLQAVPFALEEQLAEDVDKLHFAIGKRDRDGPLPVAVAARSRLEEWLHELSEAAIEPDALYAETEGLPAIPNAYSLLVDGDTCLIRDPAGTTTVMEDLSLREVVDLLELTGSGPADAGAAEEPDGDAELTPIHINLYLDQADHEGRQEDIEWLREQVSSLEVKLLPDGALPHLAVQAGAGSGINLLQGSYAPVRETGSLWKPWRLAATLLIGLLATMLIVEFVELERLKAQETKLDDAMAALVKKACPRTRRIVNPRAQLEQCAETSGANTDSADQQFLYSLATLGSVIAETPNTRITALSFRNAIMDLRLMAPNVDALDKIRRLVIERSDMDAVIQSATPKDAAIEGRLQLKGADS